jgi:two-component system chemotaxis response regulator CheB
MSLRRSSTPPGPSASAIRCVAIGASTGGPAAVLDVLRGLPRDFPIPIALVIHIGRVFAQSLAEWLDGESPIRVRQAKDGELWPLLGSSSVLIAPSDRHMTISNGRIWLTHEAERHSCRPSVDVLFDSVARNFGAAGAGCLLTGMGKDGAEGLLHIRQSGGPTIAQDEASSVIYGMPREAAEIGAASSILPLNKIARALQDLAGPATK